MVSVTTTAAMGRHLMPWVNNTVRLSLNPSRMIPRRNSLLEISPAASFTPDFALLEITLGPLTGLSKTQLGITAGASLHEIAHAVAAGDAFGAVDIATIMKLSRVLMLVFAAIIIAI